MFHCNGWCFTWAVTAVGATHVCLRKVDPPLVWRLIDDEGVTHLNGAPTVLVMLASDPAARRARAAGARHDRRCSAAAGRDRAHRGAGLPDQPRLRPDRDLRADHDLRVEPRLGRARRRGAGAPEGAPGPRDAHRRPGARGRSRDAGRPRRRRDDGRGRDAREQRDEGLLRRPGGDRRGVSRRLVPLGRSRRDAPGRLRRAARPRQGHHHLGRREHLDDRGRAGARPPPRRARGRGGRDRRREVGRAAEGVRDAAPRRDAHRARS